MNTFKNWMEECKRCDWYDFGMRALKQACDAIG